MRSPAKHLYIHWPFCSKKCHYCDFVAFQQHEEFQEAYHNVLLQEISAYANSFNQIAKPPIDTIFIGGGTPSLYDLAWIKELFTHLHKHFDLTQTKEITIEANPSDIDEEKLEAWRELGITRISMGVQCLNDDVLIGLNRRQRATDVYRALRLIPKYFDNLSIDLILGLPGISPTEWFATLEQAVTWPINHISIYFLTVHEKTPLYFSVQEGKAILADDQTMIDMYKQTVHFLERHGIDQYEISNFAKPGFASLHNQAYWERKPYKGFGVGASSFDGHKRSTNDNNLTRYLQIDTINNSHDISRHEILTPQQELLELLMLGLRQKKGLDLHRVVYFLNDEEKKRFTANLTSLIEAELIEQLGSTIRLTLKGMVIENDVVVRLL